MKSVKSIHPWKSVIQTINDIVKAHGGEIKVETLSAEAAAQAGKDGEASPDDPIGRGTEFTIHLPVND